MADSGNGGHLRYGIKLPNDADSTKLIAECLASLRRKFEDARVKIDPTNVNPSRACKIYGTLSRKGDSTPSRPHRLSKILQANANAGIVRIEQLTEFAALAADSPNSENADLGNEDTSSSSDGQKFDVQRWIDKHQVPVGISKPWDDGLRWEGTGYTCLFGGDHPGNSSYIIQAPNGAISARCHHAGCGGSSATGSANRWPELRRKYEPNYDKKRKSKRGERNEGFEGPADDEQRPIIKLGGGHLPWLVDREQEVLAEIHHKTRIYERANLLVRINPVDADQAAADKKKYKIERPVGAVVLKDVTPITLEDVLTRHIAFLKFLKTDEEWHPVDCPAKHAQVVLDRAGDGRLPNLLGVITAPIMRDDGSILSKPGYDEKTGLYLYGDIEWLPILDTPTLKDAQSAIKTLIEPFGEFPFVDPADRSVLLSAILTALQRRLLDFAPLFGFDAPLQSTGKTLAADSLSLIATGRTPVCVSDPVDETEMRKLITTLLMAGDAIVLVDNVLYGLRSPALAKVLTETEHTDRILGVHKQARVPTNVTWMCSGNNLTFAGDMPSRVLIARMDAEIEHPENRTFKISDLRKHVLENRPQLVQAALMVLRAYYVAGRPSMNLTPSRFARWDKEIRSALVWAGAPDPVATRARVDSNDPERTATARVLTCWHRNPALGTAVTVAQVIEASREDKDLRAALLEVATDRTAPDILSPRRLGNWCRYRRGRIVAGLRLEKVEDSNLLAGALWKVAPSSPPDNGDSEDSEDSGFIHRARKSGNTHTPLQGEKEIYRPETESSESSESSSFLPNSANGTPPNKPPPSTEDAEIVQLPDGSYVTGAEAAEIDRLAEQDADKFVVDESADQKEFFRK